MVQVKLTLIGLVIKSTKENLRCSSLCALVNRVEHGQAKWTLSFRWKSKWSNTKFYSQNAGLGKYSIKRLCLSHVHTYIWSNRVRYVIWCVVWGERFQALNVAWTQGTATVSLARLRTDKSEEWERDAGKLWWDRGESVIYILGILTLIGYIIWTCSSWSSLI